MEESCRSLSVSRNVALTLDRSLDVFNSFSLNPTTFFRVLTALRFADMASSLISVPLSLTPEINSYTGMHSRDDTEKNHKTTAHVLLCRNRLQCFLLVIKHNTGLPVFHGDGKAAYHILYSSLLRTDEVILGYNLLYWNMISVHSEITEQLLIHVVRVLHVNKLNFLIWSFFYHSLPILIKCLLQTISCLDKNVWEFNSVHEVDTSKPRGGSICPKLKLAARNNTMKKKWSLQANWHSVTLESLGDDFFLKILVFIPKVFNKK